MSLLLSDKIKQLYQERIEIQEKLLIYKEEEKKRLSLMVEEKTSELSHSLVKNKILLIELNHRIKNSMMVIISFIRLQRRYIDKKDPITLQVLDGLENKVFAINALYERLHKTDNISNIHTYEYFQELINNISISFGDIKVVITLDTNIVLDSETALYCGIILNEAMTNAYQHAFLDTSTNTIYISLTKEKESYIFKIKDNGIGCKNNELNKGNSLGLSLIDTLVTLYFKGRLVISSNNGVTINIKWREDV